MHALYLVLQELFYHICNSIALFVYQAILDQEEISVQTELLLALTKLHSLYVQAVLLVHLYMEHNV